MGKANAGQRMTNCLQTHPPSWSGLCRNETNYWAMMCSNRVGFLMGVLFECMNECAKKPRCLPLTLGEGHYSKSTHPDDGIPQLTGHG